MRYVGEQREYKMAEKGNPGLCSPPLILSIQKQPYLYSSLLSFNADLEVLR